MEEIPFEVNTVNYTKNIVAPEKNETKFQLRKVQSAMRKTCAQISESDITSISQQSLSKEGACDIAELLRSPKFDANLVGLKALRRMLSKNIDINKKTDVELIDEVMRNGLLPRIVKFLYNPSGVLQNEAAWILTNLATGDTRQTRYIVEAKAVEGLVESLRSSDEKLQQQSAWALGNIATDCIDFRDYALSKGIAESILYVLTERQENLSLLQTTIWLFSILSKEVREEDFRRIAPLVPILREMLKHPDNSLVAECAWSIASLTSTEDKNRKKEIVYLNMPAALVPLLSRIDQIIKPALKAIENIIAENDKGYTQELIDLGLMEPLLCLLESPDEEIRWRCCTILADLTSEHQDYVDCVIHFNPLPVLTYLVQNDSDRVKKEIVKIFCHIVRTNVRKLTEILVAQDAAESISPLLESPDDEVVLFALETLKTMLKFGHIESTTKFVTNPVAVRMQHCCGISSLETLLAHQNSKIYRAAFNLLEKYFNG